ncbi:hypothetical protein QUA35_00150 [Microcoleus sp. N9_B2]|uniref:hypothetical protein n=1 Tax=unclassified Microcoleus TaxID=2642155 RepID=UPI002FD3F0AB
MKKQEGRSKKEEARRKKADFPTLPHSPTPPLPLPHSPLGLLPSIVVVAIVQLKCGCSLVISSGVFVHYVLSSGICDLDRL